MQKVGVLRAAASDRMVRRGWKRTDQMGRMEEGWVAERQAH